MKRFAFKMKLKNSSVEEYKKRHDNIWPEIVDILKKTGISDYSIYYDDETNILFAFQKQNGESSSQDIGELPVVQKWWDYMADIMETNSDDNSPISIPLKEVFYME